MLISTRCKVLLFIVFFVIGKGFANNPVRILTIGDSTMANYDEEKNSGEKEMRGWAQMLPVFVKDNVKVDNAAKNGRSSKSFYLEFWKDLRETLRPSDYVFIQFGHNDEKNKGLDDEIGNPKRRGTAAWGQYQNFLTIYVNESRERGAIPVLMTPVVRRLFEGDTIIGIGRHSLTELAPDDSTMNYPKSMRALAEKLHVPLVDMTELTRELVEGMGAEKAKEVIYANNDNTHLKAMGGILFSRLAVNDLLRQGILTDYLTLSTGLSIKPDNYDFGLQFAGKEATKAFSLTGLDMQPEKGMIDISVPPPFSLSTTLKGVTSTTIRIPYSNGNTSTNIYVKLLSDEIGKTEGMMNVSLNGKNIKQLKLKGESISTENTKRVKLNWTGGETSTSDQITLRTKLEGLIFQKVDSLTVINTPDNKWSAGDIDMDASRYIEFSILPEKTTLFLDSVLLDMGAVGGRNMRFTALGSVDEKFTDTESFAIMEPLQNEKTKLYVSDKIIRIPKGKKYYIRIYPWYESLHPSKDKYLQIRNMQINGITFNE